LLGYLICIIVQPLFPSGDFYFESQQYYNLKNYRTNPIVSKTYFRTLIAYYFYDKKNQNELISFLQQKQPEFYWLALQLWENPQELNKSHNPAIKVWLKFLNLEDVQNLNYAELIQDCEYFGEIFCNWLNDVSFIYNNYYIKNKKINEEDYEILLKRLEIYLTKSNFIPFMYFTAKWLPEYLRRIGLNLESAILLKNMMYRQKESIQKTLTEELAYSIFLAGDPDYAIKLLINFPNNTIRYQSNYFHLFNLLSLSKNFEGSIKFLKDEKITNQWNLQNALDVWTSFPVTKFLIKIRLADLIYWHSKNPNEAIIFLERLITNKGLNELEKQYARLVQSRILYNTNVELAQRIAEDVQFKAQEKNFYLLEYYATIWNGWCLYKLKKYYPSNIEFTKAYNISRRHFPNISSYSVYLGLLLTKRMYQLTDENLILHLNKIFDNYIPDAYFFTTMEWIPEDIHYDIWKDIYIEQLYHTKRFNVLNQFIFSSYDNFFYFEQSKNPGNILGIYTNFLYCKYVQCSYNYEIPLNSSTKKIDLDKYLLLYQTTKYYYIFIKENNKINYIKIEKSQQSRSEVVSKINEYKDFTIFLNPHVDITHYDIIKNFGNHFKFKLAYNKLDDSKLKEIPKDFSCSINEKGNILILSDLKNIRKEKGFPFLTRFVCNNSSVRLWDLERFFPKNKKVYFFDMGEEPEIYQAFYYMSVRKNWYLVYVIDQNHWVDFY
jgi:hypothetical protein